MVMMKDSIVLSNMLDRTDALIALIHMLKYYTFSSLLNIILFLPVFPSPKNS